MKKYSFTIAGKKYEVEIASIEGGNASVSVNGKSYTVALDGAQVCHSGPDPESVPQASPSHSGPAPESAPQVSPSGKETAVPSPMQGTVVEVKVAEGQAVKSGDTVIVIESMKMEVEIASTADGVVKAVKVSKGDQLEEGQTVVIIA